MKIIEILIENYKSIKCLLIRPTEGINVVIGENSVGKSNVFDAINWLIGPVYPTFNSTFEHDHFQGNVANKIKIRLTFSDGNYLELAEQWTDNYGHEKSGLNFNGSYVKDEVRQRYCSAYLGIERQVVDYMPSNRWSLMGRVLLEINKLFCKEEFTDEETGEVTLKSDYLKQELKRLRDDVLFSVKDATGRDVMKAFISLIQKESAKHLNRPEGSMSIDLNLYDPWHFYRTMQLLVQEEGQPLQFQASKLGMGVQAAISIAILKAYASLKLNNGCAIFIDEPELFLHPQAQRNFYKVLRELADSGTQIFITTHSPDFLNVGRFDEIFIVTKCPREGTCMHCANPQAFVEDLLVRRGIVSTREEMLLQYSNAYDNTGDTQKANEAFFAKKILLVEGSSEALILPYFFDLVDYDYLGKCLSIVRCGSKGELDRFYRLYTEFGIPTYVLFDGDKQHLGTADERDTVAKNRALLSLFGVDADFPDGQDHELYYGFEKELGKYLGFNTGSLKGLSLYKKTKEVLQTRDDIPVWVERLITRLEMLPAKPASVLLHREEVIAA
ncbi:ATP-dependent nuclease [Hymenobacter negativus]|uniref:AAA family ATPase n=1 Tax=Hymenobacter negativus TaxID=2795026 RepID=A0ABS0Q8K5_9BACT|nr:AAA family ATPase [Hymenobacter negativus]MBH8558581.1 AAA family ATPase [Hymenobacter negativus]